MDARIPDQPGDGLSCCEAARPRQRQAAYRTRREALGLTQVAVWVPASRRAEVHAEATRLRLEAGLPLPGEEVASQLSLFSPDPEPLS